MKLVDDLGRTLVFGQPPSRVVSLVPSDTHSVIALGAAHTLVGRTRYCESPEAASVPVVGGTKDVDVEAVLALAPQLVIANQEENTRAALQALAAARIPVLVSLPRRVADGVAHLARLARILRVGDREPARSLIRRGYELRAAPPPTARAFVPIWMDPLMTLNADTFGSDVLAQVGVANAFNDRLRLYPLAADLGRSDRAARRAVRVHRRRRGAVSRGTAACTRDPRERQGSVLVRRMDRRRTRASSLQPLNLTPKQTTQPGGAAADIRRHYGIPPPPTLRATGGVNDASKPPIVDRAT